MNSLFIRCIKSEIFVEDLPLVQDNEIRRQVILHVSSVDQI